MEVRASERRVSRRLQVKTALQVRIWKSGSTERNAESENLSERGAFFATDAPLAIGSAVEILETMPEEITGKPTSERPLRAFRGWRKLLFIQAYRQRSSPEAYSSHPRRHGT